MDLDQPLCTRPFLKKQSDSFCTALHNYFDASYEIWSVDAGDSPVDVDLDSIANIKRSSSSPRRGKGVEVGIEEDGREKTLSPR